jgi:hypothetical protein
MNTANGEPEIDPEHYFDLKPLDENVLFAVSDPQVLSKPMTGAELEAIEDAAFKRKENVLEKFKRQSQERRKVMEGTAYLVAGIGTLSPYKADGSRNTVYIAGPMTGYDQYNFPAFDAARDDLTAKGFKVISPADIDREIGFDPSVGTLDDFDLPAAIRRDVDAILGCDAVVLLPGHETSRGATAERYVAKWAGIPCYTYPDLKPYTGPQWPGAVDDWEFDDFDKASRETAAETVSPVEGFTPIPIVNTWSYAWADSVVTETPKADAKPNELRDGDTVTNERGGKQSFIAARFDCIPPECLRLLAQCLGYGAKRYGKENWRQIDIEDNIAHAMNHLNEWRRGDRSEPHLVNTLARVTFALSQAVASGAQSDTYVHPDA